MNHLIEYWSIYVAIAAILVIVAFSLYVFIKSPQSEQMKKVKAWLLFAVTQAEAELGEGTGQLKLVFVYNLFVSKFVWISRLITYDMFSLLVDEALEEMRQMLKTNEAVIVLVKGDE